MTALGGRRRWLGVGLVALLAVGGVFALRRSDGSGVPRDPLGRLPAHTDALLVVDLPALRDSSAWHRLVVARGGAVGLERLRRRCGVDPLQGVKQLTVWVGGAPARPIDGLAVQFLGHLPVERLVGCLQTALEADPDAGELRQVELRGRPALQSASGRSSAVALGDRLVLLGATQQLGAALEVLDGERSSAQADFGPAWAALSSGAQLVLLARVRPAWFERLPEGPLDGSALRALQWLGVAVRLGPPLSMRLEARFASPEAAVRVAQDLKTMRRRLAALPAALRGPFAEWLLGWRIETERARLLAEGSWELDLLGSLLDAALGAGAPRPSAIGGGGEDDGSVESQLQRFGGRPDGGFTAPQPGARDAGP